MHGLLIFDSFRSVIWFRFIQNSVINIGLFVFNESGPIAKTNVVQCFSFFLSYHCTPCALNEIDLRVYARTNVNQMMLLIALHFHFCFH